MLFPFIVGDVERVVNVPSLIEGNSRDLVDGPLVLDHGIFSFPIPAGIGGETPFARQGEAKPGFVAFCSGKNATCPREGIDLDDPPVA